MPSVTIDTEAIAAAVAAKVFENPASRRAVVDACLRRIVLLKPSQVAAALSCGRAAVDSLPVPVHNIPGAGRRYLLSDIEEYLAVNRGSGAAAVPVAEAVDRLAEELAKGMAE